MGIITTHLRSGAFEALFVRRFADGARLYAAAFLWNVALQRWKFLAGYPVVWMLMLLGIKKPPTAAPRASALMGSVKST